MNTGMFEVGRTYVAAKSSLRKRDEAVDKRILALTEREGNTLTFALVSGVVQCHVDSCELSSEFAQVRIDDSVFNVFSSISPSLSQLEEANSALKAARAAV